MKKATKKLNSWNDVFHHDDQERAWEKWSHSLETGEPYEIEYRLRRYDGEYRWFLGRAVPINITSEIVARDNKVCARIVVKDNGIGFEQKYAEKIFGSFTRLHTKDEYEGAGLGLSLCKTIIERHGGSIKATSAEDEGTEFEIMLPVKT